MIKDPLAEWAGPTSYDVLAVTGITPDSSMREVLDASFDLMERNLMEPEVRAAWDHLRLKQRRLFVDFFLYQFDPGDELRRAQEALARQFAEVMKGPDVAHLLRAGPEALSQIEQDFRELPAQHGQPGFIPEFESRPALPDPEFIQFDL